VATLKSVPVHNRYRHCDNISRASIARAEEA